MYSLVQIKKIAINMRKNGASYSEIKKKLPIGKGTLSLWLAHISISRDQKEEILMRGKEKILRGRMQASIARRARRMIKENTIYAEAEKEFKNLVSDPFFMTGLAMYAMRGSRQGTSLQFSSSDKFHIALMDKWIKKYLGVGEDIVKKRNYRGYLSIVVTRVNVLRKMVAWQKLLIKYYSDVSSV